MDRAGKGIRFYKHPLSPRPKNLVDGEVKDIHVSRLKFYNSATLDATDKLK